MADLSDFCKTSAREDLIRFAKLAEQTERYNDMVMAMKSVTVKGPRLDQEERSLLSVAYKHALSSRRSSWRAISMLEMKMEEQGHAKKHSLATQFRQQVEEELNKICKDILRLLEEHLIPNADSAENSVFYHKMQGDYLRYMAEVATGEERKGIVESSETAYKTADECANNFLPASHPIRLGLALNYAIFYYETRCDIISACQLARKAFESAVDMIDYEADDRYKDSALIMQLLRDNLTLWTAEQVAEVTTDDD